MNLTALPYALLTVAVGALFPIQSAANALLGRAVGGPVAATLVSFASGFVVLVSVNAALFRQWPRLADLAAQPFWLLWLGGSIGAVFLSANVFLAPRLGSAATLGFVMAGQLASALVIDKFGLFGFALREVTLGRIGGVALVVVGALMVLLT